MPSTTWEMDASAVHIDNSEDWQRFLDGRIRWMCDHLGMDHGTLAPWTELDKLLVYETGSCLLPHITSAKADGAFASMVVLLPSEFSGGADHLSHGEHSTVLDLGAKSSTHTSILAWFNDITHEVKPITSGYRLALSYNLIHTTAVPRPFFTPLPSLVQSFRKALTSWGERKDATPFKIVFLLGYKYPSAGLSLGSLKGSDAQVVALLKDLGQELGFCLALDTAEYYTIEGCEDEDDDGWQRSELSIKTPVDLDGNQLGHLNFFKDDTRETIPATLGYDICSGSAYKEVDTDNHYGGGSLERWYRRTVLLIWPELHTVELDFGANFSPILEALRKTHSTKPSKQERRITDYLMRAAISKRVPHKETLQSVSHAATRWKDLDLWERTVAVCGGDHSLEYLGDEGLSDAVSYLGFADIQITVEKILETEGNNTIRFKALQRLEYLQETSQAQDMPAAWLGAQRRKVIQSLKEPQYYSDLQLFLDLLQQSQADPPLRANILSQLTALGRPWFLIHFACLLHCEKTSFSCWVDGTATINNAVQDILSLAISKTNLPERPLMYGSEGTAQLAHICLLACLKTENDDLGGSVIRGLLSFIAKEKQESNRIDKGATKTLIHLMPLLANTLRAYPQLTSLPGIKGLYLAAIRVTRDLEHQLLGLAAAIWLSGEIELVETIGPDIQSLDSRTKRRVKSKLKSLLNSVLSPSKEEWRPVLERLLKHVETPQAPSRKRLSVSASLSKPQGSTAVHSTETE